MLEKLLESCGPCSTATKLVFDIEIRASIVIFSIENCQGFHTQLRSEGHRAIGSFQDVQVQIHILYHFDHRFTGCDL
jgi:hypothetical protein